MSTDGILVTHAPGDPVETSGIYQAIDLDGNVFAAADGDPQEATCTRGEPFPPTKQPGYRWFLARKTHHQPKYVD